MRWRPNAGVLKNHTKGIKNEGLENKGPQMQHPNSSALDSENEKWQNRHQPLSWWSYNRSGFLSVPWYLDAVQEKPDLTMWKFKTCIWLNPGNSCECQWERIINRKESTPNWQLGQADSTSGRSAGVKENGNCWYTYEKLFHLSNYQREASETMRWSDSQNVQKIHRPRAALN